jgi:hypothetical protein
MSLNKGFLSSVARAEVVNNNSLKRVVQVMLSGGFDAMPICTDGDGSYTCECSAAYAHGRS